MNSPETFASRRNNDENIRVKQAVDAATTSGACIWS